MKPIWLNRETICTKHLSNSTETVIYLLADKTSCYLPRGETEKGSCKDKIRHKDKMSRWLMGGFGSEYTHKDKIGRWFYDAHENRCHKYGHSDSDPDTDGGCVGIGNNFETKFLCDKICKLP